MFFENTTFVVDVLEKIPYKPPTTESREHDRLFFGVILIGLNMYISLV
jgi:hypothetical protein